MKDYRAVLERFYQLNRVDKFKYDLSRMDSLCAFYGNPQNAFPCVHVTGTNGKGSFVYKLGQVMKESGLRAGVFQSPHVTTFRERISINDFLVEPRFVEDFLRSALRLIDQGKLCASFFELLTVMAFSYFREQNVDVACVEVGIGGRLDATNVLSRSLLSVVTSVGLDHCELLGDTVELIAREKCGIIRKGSAALAGPTVPRAVFDHACATVGAEGHVLPQEVLQGKTFQELNNLLVLRAVEILSARGVSLLNPLPTWLERNLKCRMELVPEETVELYCPGGPRAVYLDVGHNSQAIGSLLASLEFKHPDAKFYIIYGSSKKKDVRSVLAEIAKRTSEVTLIQADSLRAKSVKEIAEEAAAVPIACKIFEEGNISVTLSEVLSSSEIKDKVVVICGSFFIMEEVRFSLGYEDEHDPFFLNEIRISLADLPNENLNF